MRRIDGGAERAGRRLANFGDVISATGRTWCNFAISVQLDVGRQVIGKIDRCAIGQMIHQCELICCGVNLTQVVDAGIGRT